MCRQSRNNRYKKCYLKKPKLATIPEEVGDGTMATERVVMAAKHEIARQQSYSPKGIKRLLGSAYSGTSSPRSQKKANGNNSTVKNVNKRNTYTSYGTSNKERFTNNSRNFADSLYVITPSVGDASPRCRRLRKTEQNSATFLARNGGNNDVIVAVKDGVELSGKPSPRTIKKLIMANGNLGNHSPPSHRVVSKGNNNNTDYCGSLPDIGKVKVVDSNIGNQSPPSGRLNKKVAKNNQRNRSDSLSSLGGDGKVVAKEKSMFKRVVKFLTVPPKNDFVAC